MIRHPIRVLVVDDSAFMRKAIREMLEKNPRVEVAGTAWNGRDALEKVKDLQPDVVIIDLYMPEFDGIRFVREQMARRPLPIVVCSSAIESGEGAGAALDAGAVEFVQKPTALALDTMYNIQNRLVEAVLAAASVPLEKLPQLQITEAPAPVLPEKSTRAERVDAVLIGVSTGGPGALRSLLPRFPTYFPVPIAIALHMPLGYTRQLAEKLDELSQIAVIESENGLEMKAGRAILAQAGVHTCLKRKLDGKVVTYLSEEPLDSLYVPAVDELFKTGAEVYNGRLLGVVLTGMGNDGTLGSAWIKGRGGIVFAETERSSIVYGMPRSVVEAGLADQTVDLNDLAEAIMEIV